MNMSFCAFEINNLTFLETVLDYLLPDICDKFITIA